MTNNNITNYYIMISIENLHNVTFKPYKRYNQLLKGLYWHNINYSDITGVGTYLLKFSPNTYTKQHKHLDYENFYVLSGSIYDSLSKKTYYKNSFVSLEKNTIHYSYSKDGCIVLVFSQGHIERFKQSKL